MSIEEEKHSAFMQRCLELAAKGAGNVRSNPMVGAVIVHSDRIIGEGWHHAYGKPHAEVNAIAAVSDASLLENSVLYVNLEPCSHFGKTPPCADLIIEKKIPRVVVGSSDPNPLVSGKGIAKLREAGVEVIAGCCVQAADALNKRFMTYHRYHRPYIILKWAETNDHFIDGERDGSEMRPLKITTAATDKIVHQWRAEEMAILVGTRTALMDNPALTVRHATGNNPVRMVIDKHLEIPSFYQLMNNVQPTVVFTELAVENLDHIRFVPGDPVNMIPDILRYCFENSINSLIVEGGASLLRSFINNGIWDEARVIRNAEITAGKGVAAPALREGLLLHEETYGNESVSFFRNPFAAL